MERATYITILNFFEAWSETHPLSPPAQVLWFRLLGVFNRAFWPPEVTIDRRRMQALCALGEKAYIKAAAELSDSGLVTCEAGERAGAWRFSMDYDLFKDKRQLARENSILGKKETGSPSFDVEAFTRRACETTPKI